MKRWIDSRQLLTKLGLCVSIAIASIILMASAVPIFAAESPEITVNTAEVPPVYVPIVLDGVLYQPNEFNKIHIELYAKGTYLHYATDHEKDIEMAFSSWERRDKWLKDHGYPTATEILDGTAAVNPVKVPPSGSERGSCPADNSMVNHWDINFNGAEYDIDCGDSEDDLRTVWPGWDNDISSICGSDECSGIVYADLDFGGESKIIIRAYDYTNLHVIGWGDRISSIAMQ